MLSVPPSRVTGPEPRPWEIGRRAAQQDASGFQDRSAREVVARIEQEQTSGPVLAGFPPVTWLTRVICTKLDGMSKVHRAAAQSDPAIGVGVVTDELQRAAGHHKVGRGGAGSPDRAGLAGFVQLGHREHALGNDRRTGERVGHVALTSMPRYSVVARTCRSKPHALEGVVPRAVHHKPQVAHEPAGPRWLAGVDAIPGSSVTAPVEQLLVIRPIPRCRSGRRSTSALPVRAPA